MAATQVMQCMEVWGGNALVDSAVRIAGLDAWVYSKPYGQADGGGDVYYVSSCATGRITRLLVADVCGHGAAVCDVAGQLRGLMRRYVNYLDQAAFVRAMNDQLAANARAGCFATALVTTFFGPTRRLSLCNAGHPPPLVYRAASRQWSYMERSDTPDCDPKNLPLGILGLGEYDQFDEHLRDGDVVLCYTDSLVEARDPTGELVGQEGLLRLVRGLDAAEPRLFLTSLLDAIAALAPGNLDADDVTALLFRPNGQAPAGLPLAERLRAPLRLARAFVQSLRPGGPPMPWPDLRFANLGGAVFSPFNRLWRSRTE